VHHFCEWPDVRPFRARSGNDIHWDLKKLIVLLKSFYEYPQDNSLIHNDFVTIVEALDAFVVAAGIPFPLGSPGARAEFLKNWTGNCEAEYIRARNEAQVQYQANVSLSDNADMDEAEPEL
jgi:hypothetical protein